MWYYNVLKQDTQYFLQFVEKKHDRTITYKQETKIINHTTQDVSGERNCSKALYLYISYVQVHETIKCSSLSKKLLALYQLSHSDLGKIGPILNQFSAHVYPALLMHSWANWAPTNYEISN